MTPDEYTNQELMLDVDHGHSLYVHDWGKSDAQTPILFLHGGPGGGCSDSKKNQFDPETQRVIFFDQRGSGRSLPYGSLEANTTQALVGDIVTILDHFNIAQTILTGGSWGSALAFHFAIAHPDRVQALVVDGVWTASKTETDWVDQGGFRTFFPDVWRRYVASVPIDHQLDPSAYHFPRILSDDIDTSKESAFAYESLEGAIVKLDDRFRPGEYETYDPSSVRIEVHYITNGCFMPDRYIFDNADKLTMPIYMIQGRYDMVCPPQAAYELAQLLPDSHLTWTIGGHISERETWNVKKAILVQLTA